METTEQKDRREKRMLSMQNCETPADLAINIWPKKMDETIGDRSIYRNPFIEWIESYKAKTTPKIWNSYKTPSDLANGIWPSYLDRSDKNGLFLELRNTLVGWIESYTKNKQ